MVLVIEHVVWIESPAIDAGFKMQMLGSSATGAPRQGNDVTGFYLVAHSDEVLAVVRIAGLQTVGVANSDTLAVGRVGASLHYETVEDSIYLLLWSILDIYSGVTALASIATNDVGIIERVAERLDSVEVNTIDCFVAKRIISVHAHAFWLLVFRFLACGLYVDAFLRLFESGNLIVQCVCFDIENNLRIDSSSIHHDAEKAIYPAGSATYDGDGLTGFHLVAHSDKVLSIVPIDRLQTVVMAHYDNVSVCGTAS